MAIRRASPLADRHRVVAPDLPLGGHAHPVVAGTPLGLPGQARIVADLLPDVTVQPIADSYAFSPVDQPHVLAQSIAAFAPARA